DAGWAVGLDLGAFDLLLPLAAPVEIIDVGAHLFRGAVDLDALDDRGHLRALLRSRRWPHGTTTILARLRVWLIRVGESSVPTTPGSVERRPKRPGSQSPGLPVTCSQNAAMRQPRSRRSPRPQASAAPPSSAP